VGVRWLGLGRTNGGERLLVEVNEDLKGGRSRVRVVVEFGLIDLESRGSASLVILMLLDSCG